MRLTAPKFTAVPTQLSRRTVLGALPATMVLAACSSGGTDDASFDANAQNSAAIDHSAWDALLREYVMEGSGGVNLVDYSRLQIEAEDQLEAYLQAMQNIAIEDYSRDEQFAFWVNLYNAATVDVILKNYPLASIRDIGLLGQGPWKDDAVTVSGKTLSLDNIEHDILRPVWQDVRIHYAVNCASIGCPNLATQAYTADKLEAMLDEAAAAFVNHPRGFGGTADAIVASNIYEWYEEDWGSAEAVLEHAREYATGPTAELLANATEIDGYDYDWAINEL
jgi:hypothetical protein